MTPQQVAEMEAQKFLDSNFGQLDLSGCPTCLTQPSEEADLPDPRFAPLDNRGAGLGAAALKSDIEKMVYDPEVQVQIARETGNAGLLADIQMQQAEEIAREFRRLNPSYYRSPENWETLVRCLAYNFLSWEPDEGTTQEAQDELIKRGYWTLDNLTAAFQELSREGSFEGDPTEPRRLTEHQRRSIALQASTGDVEGAISRYLRERLPEPAAAQLVETFGLEDMYDQLAEPEYKSILEEAVWFCWQYARTNYAPTQERRRFMQGYIAGRIPTAKLLDEAWRTCQEAERDALRTGVLSQVSNGDDSVPDLDGMSDEEINFLYRQTARKLRTPSLEHVGAV